MKFFGNLIEISTTQIKQYPGDTQGDSIVATLKGSADKGETAQVYGMPGYISRPAKGTKAIRLRIGSLDIIIGALNYSVPLPDESGATKVYSTDSDGEQAGAIELTPEGDVVALNENGYLSLNDDGTIELNGATDNAVSFADLQLALNNFKTSIELSIAGAITGHTHTGVTTGPGTSGSGAGAAPPITIDISASKVEEVKLP